MGQYRGGKGKSAQSTWRTHSPPYTKPTYSMKHIPTGIGDLYSLRNPVVISV
jgi:hypothetical protein